MSVKAMILAAGLGTRLKPFTNQHPKALAEVNGKTLLQRNIEYLMQFGVRDIIVNVHHFADQVIAHIEAHDGFGARISVSDEREQLLDTGGGLFKASWFLKDSDPFILMNADILTDLDLNGMLQAHQQQNPLATLAVTLRQSSRYLLFDESDLLCGWENAVSREQKLSRSSANFIPKAFSGIHVISPDIFNASELSGKFSVIDLYLSLSHDHAVLGYDHSGSRFIDVGKPGSVEEAANMFS